MAEEKKILRLVEQFEQVFEDVVLPHQLEVQHEVPEDGTLAELLEACVVDCEPLGDDIRATDCFACDRFISCRRNGDGGVLLNCWGHKPRVRMAKGTKQHAAVLPKLA